MIRLVQLSVAGAVIFAGFAMPFIFGGIRGLLLCVLIISFGSILLWIVEKKTVSSLDKDSLLNDSLNTQDGPD